MEVTTQPGVTAPVTQEAVFQGLFEQGAFEPPKREPEVQPETQPEPEVKAEPEVEPETQPETKSEPEEEVYATLDDLLKAKGIDPESARTLSVTTKVDGQEKLVPLADILKSYQLESHVNNKSIELSNQQKQWESERQAARSLIAQQLQQTQQLGQLAQQQLTHEYNNIDWATLRVQNPAEFAALQTEFGQRQQAIQGYLGTVREQQAAQEQERQAMLATQIETQRTEMLNRHPEWKDQAAFAAARDKMLDYAKAKGFSEAELSQVYDHRLMDILHDAASFQTLQAAKPEALKRVREAPKMAKPGTRQTTDPQQAAKQAAIDRYNANPHDVDAQVALFSHLT